MVGGPPNTYMTEIVSLTEGESIPDCLNALSNHPKAGGLYRSAGGALPDASYQPHICGSYVSPNNECWAYTPSDDTWTKTSTIPRDFDRGASAFHPAWGIIMSGGGLDDDEMTVTKDIVEFEELEPMPYASYDHCVAAVNANTLFTTGLGSSDDESYMYYKDTKEWVSLPNMPTGRYAMGCGVVSDGSGKVEVVVVGGYNSGYLTTVEVFNIEENSWRTASNPFPTEITEMAVAQHDTTFYIVGGRHQTQVVVSDTIYRYKVSDESWELMPNRMKYERYGATPMMVNASLFPTCD